MVNIQTTIEETKRLYIQGKLTAEEIEAFETYFIDKPQLLEELELDMLLKQHLPTVTLEQKSAQSQRQAGWLSWFAKPLIASLATFVICGVSFTWYLQGQKTAFESSGKVNLVYISPMRDSGNKSDEQPHAILSSNSGDEQITLVLQPTVMEATRFNIKMLNPQGDQVVAFDKVNIQGMGDLVVTVPSQLLTPGDWIFEVSPVGQPELQERLLLRSMD